MSLPYSPPVKVPTKLRCHFSLSGMARRYDCRRIGCYLLNGKRYCAPHYDIAWKVVNPVFGQQHDWHFHFNRFTELPSKYETCRRCGDIKQHEGLPQSPCRGVTPKIELKACS